MKSGPKKTACLREPMFAVVLAHHSPLVSCCRGVFAERFRSLRGITGSGVCLVFSGVGKRTRTWPGINRFWFRSDSPTPDPSPNLGEPHRIESRRSGGRSGAVFLCGARKSDARLLAPMRATTVLSNAETRKKTEECLLLFSAPPRLRVELKCTNGDAIGGGSEN